MNVFDHPDPHTLNTRDTQLWFLAIALLAVFSLGIAALMYPAVFSSPVILTDPYMKIVFFGFCGLSALTLGYLVDRQLVIQRLRRRLAEEQMQRTDLISQTSADLLDSLPGLSHFQDRLAMEFRRSANADQPLTILTVTLGLTRSVLMPREIITAFGDAAKAIMRRLRGVDSLFFFRAGVFAVILPQTSTGDANKTADQITEGLSDASGACDRYTFSIKVFNYPDDTSSASVMERIVRAASERSFDGLVSIEERPPGSTREAKSDATHYKTLNQQEDSGAARLH